MSKKLDIIYEDSSILIVNKPAGLLTIPDRFDPEKPNLYHQLQQKYPEVITVHRLDRETSGLLCFALNPDVHRHLSIQFEQRAVKKTYLALVEGTPNPGEGEIEKALAPHPVQKGKMVISNKGKPSLTHYRSLENFHLFSLMEVEIKTGRTHQIRIHFSAIGHPLLVDPVYGRRKAFFLSEIKGRKYRRGKEKEERPLLKRTSLHASRLSIQHPITKEIMPFEAPLPKDLRATINQVRKWSQR